MTFAVGMLLVGVKMGEACYKSPVSVYLLKGHGLPVTLQPVSAASHRFLDERGGLILHHHWLGGEGGEVWVAWSIIIFGKGVAEAYSALAHPSTHQLGLLGARLLSSHIPLDGDGSLVLV